MSAVEERIRVLRERFAERLPDRVAEIRRTWMRMSAHPSGDLHDQFTRQLHTLAGTAGTYGMHTVAALAVEGELACDDLGGAGESVALAYLASVMEDIGAAVDTWLEGSRP